MDRYYVSRVLKKLSESYPDKHHKRYAYQNASVAILGYDKDIDFTLPEKDLILNLKRIKYVGSHISNLIVELRDGKISEDLLNDKASLLKRLRYDQEFLSSTPKTILDSLGYQTSSQWIDEIQSSIINKSNKLHLAGSLRRSSLVIKDFDIVTDCNYNDLLSLVNSTDNVEIINSGRRLVKVLLRHSKTNKELKGDIRIVNPECLASSLLFFTGSKELNIRMRGVAKSLGCKLNEYGIEIGGKTIHFNTESEIFSYLGLDYIHPSNR